MKNCNLTAQPEGESRGKNGRGHDQPGLGANPGSKKHGSHKNVVNPASHASKLKNI